MWDTVGITFKITTANLKGHRTITMAAPPGFFLSKKKLHSQINSISKAKNIKTCNVRVKRSFTRLHLGFWVSLLGAAKCDVVKCMGWCWFNILNKL
jgi:hypothetical protein